MIWNLLITASTKKQLSKLPRSDFYKVSHSIDKLRINPFIFNTKKLLAKDGTRRLRVGSYRIFFELFQKEKAIFIFNIERRTSTTY